MKDLFTQMIVQLMNYALARPNKFNIKKLQAETDKQWKLIMQKYAGKVEEDKAEEAMQINLENPLKKNMPNVRGLKTPSYTVPPSRSASKESTDSRRNSKVNLSDLTGFPFMKSLSPSRSVSPSNSAESVEQNNDLAHVKLDKQMSIIDQQKT